MLPYSMIAGGQFTVPVAGGVAAAVTVSCISQNPPDFVLARAITGWGRSANPSAIEWWWSSAMAQATANGLLQASNASTPVSAAVTATSVATLGIQTYDTSNPPLYAALACTAVNHTTWVVSMSNTGTIAVGDTVRLYNVAGMQEISGYSFQVTAVTVNTSITLGYMAAAPHGITVDGTTGFVLKYIPQQFYPRIRRVVGLTQANPAVVWFSMPNDFTIGERVSLRTNSLFGMLQINNQFARVIQVTNTATNSSIAIDLDTSGYTAFAFPTSANAFNVVQIPVCIPAASSVIPVTQSGSPLPGPAVQQPPGMNIQDAFDNRNSRLIVFGSGLFNVSAFVSTNNDAWEWQAYKYDQRNGL